MHKFVPFFFTSIQNGVGFFYLFHTNNNPFSQTSLALRFQGEEEKSRRKFILVALVRFLQSKNIRVKLDEFKGRYINNNLENNCSFDVRNKYRREKKLNAFKDTFGRPLSILENN